MRPRAKYASLVAEFAYFLFLIVIPQVSAETPSFDAKEISRQSEDRYLGDDSSAAFTMKLFNANGKVREREFLRYQKRIDGNLTTLVKFLYPNDIKDTGTLNVEVKQKDDIQYLYLPAAKKLRRVSSKNQSWVGSDFIFEDLQELEVDNYEYEALKMETRDGKEYYVYAMKPIDPGNSEYSKQIRWIDKETYVPTFIEYYDKDGKLLKKSWAEDIRLVNNSYQAWKITMENVQSNQKTELHRAWVYINSGVENDLLSTRHLEESIEFYNHPKDLKTLLETVHKPS